MPQISMRQLLEAGVHFGHQTRRWNPKMKPYIFAERNGIHIIDLAQTARLLGEALDFVTETVASGDYVLFVGTKKQAQEPVLDEATRAEQPYVNHRWLGGMLTNFVTIRKRVGLLDQLEARQASGDLDRLSKKEASQLTDEMARLQLKLGGVRKMRRLPGAIFVIDPQREKIAVTEARRLEIPVIATGDTNVDPDLIDYIIPANDDAIRSIRLLCTMVADAAIEGMGQRQARSAEEPPMGADVSDAETASDEMVAKVAAGGTYSFAPEPDEDEAVLPGEDVVDAAAVDDAVADTVPADETAAAPADAPAAVAAEPDAAADQKKDEAPAEAAS
jgi:small subunit ribosomal protein S2